MKASRRSAAIATGLLALAAGCEATRTIFDYPAPESADVAAASWPRLANTPTREAARAEAPDPLEGVVIVEALTGAAQDAQAAAERLSAPVFEVEPLLREAEATRAGGPKLDQ